MQYRKLLIPVVLAAGMFAVGCGNETVNERPRKTLKYWKDLGFVNLLTDVSQTTPETTYVDEPSPRKHNLGELRYIMIKRIGASSVAVLGKPGEYGIPRTIHIDKRIDPESAEAMQLRSRYNALVNEYTQMEKLRN